MVRKRKHGVNLPPHVHRVEAKGRIYFFHQPHRGTAREGARTSLPRDPQSVEFWYALRKLNGSVPGYTGTVAAMVDAYLGSPEFGALADSTQKVYRLYLGHSRLALGQHPPDSIRPAHVIALRDQFAETPIAANHIIRALSAVYVWGRPRDFAVNNPCQRLPRLKGGEGHKQWPEEVVDATLAAARWEVRRFLMLTLHTGQREGDVLRMSLRDIDSDLIRVTQQKTGKELWIPIHRDLKPVIDECRVSGAIALIPRGNGKNFDANQFRAMWGREMKKEALAAVRGGGLVPHGLCKNAHSRLAEVGCTPHEIQAITGRSAEMVAYYSKGANQKRLAREAIRKSEAETPEKVLQTFGIPEQNQERVGD